MHDLFLAAIQDLAYALVTVGVGFLIAFLKNKIGVTGMQKLAEQSALIKQVVEAGVKYAEQSFNGPEKLNKATEWIVATLASKGIKVTKEEVRGLIEATLRDIKDQFGEGWANSTKKEDPNVTTNV